MKIFSRFVVVAMLAWGGCGSSKDTPAQTTGAVTFWQDVAPIYNDKCVRCHQQGGIGPFRLDNYQDARAHAAVELARVTEGTMPPYYMVHDGSCGSFHDETALTDAQKATITAWVNAGQPEGTAATLTLPAQPTLAGAVDVTTPLFSPVPQGGQLAQFDEYRCFLLDAPVTADSFLTGYDVTPGDASIVHHVLGFVVNPAAMGDGNMTNAAVMKALDDQSPDRLGWPCFGGAGEGLRATGVPVTWAPGQGVVEYPQGMGMRVHPTDKVVVQVHYNLVDPASAGKTDSTAVHLRFADAVTRELAFLLPDPFLDSLAKSTPDTLLPHQSAATYVWNKTARQMGISFAAGADLVAVMPHMHQRGVRQTLRLASAAGADLACAARLEKWNFHWQEFYFYKTMPHLVPDTQVQVTCEYNTLNDDAPVLPGWGTRNEMCLVVMMLALPPS